MEQYDEFNAVKKRLALASRLGQTKVMFDLLTGYELAYGETRELRGYLALLSAVQDIISDLPARLESKEGLASKIQSVLKIHDDRVEALNELALPN